MDWNYPKISKLKLSNVEKAGKKVKIKQSFYWFLVNSNSKAINKIRIILAYIAHNTKSHKCFGGISTVFCPSLTVKQKKILNIIKQTSFFIVLSFYFADSKNEKS